MMATQAARNTKQVSSSSHTLRRSRRIATSGANGPAVQKAQGVLMKKLGIIQEQEQVTTEAKEAYAKLFEQSLSRPQLAALASLFGWSIPPDCDKWLPTYDRR